MTILLTNDDGWNSPGLQALYRHLSVTHSVYVIAPHEDKSGCSHGLTLKTPIRIKPVSDRQFICFGTPVDCVFIAAHGILPEEPDVVISGINPGPNMGTDIIYSGTAAAAREGALKNIPSIALSMLEKDPEADITDVLNFLDANLEDLVETWSADFFYNVNFPTVRPIGIKKTIPVTRQYHDEIFRHISSQKEHYYFIKGNNVVSSDEEYGDSRAVDNGYVSLSRIRVSPTIVEAAEEDLCL